VTLQTKIHSAESGHWYQLDGTPAYTLKGKNGKERNTTLADARKLGLVPSVTTILGVAAKPQLEIWKLNQLLRAQLLNPRLEGEDQEVYAKRVVEASQQISREAADLGTAIHADIERLFTGERVREHEQSAIAVQNLLHRLTGLREGWIAEASFACDMGYGGRIDLYHPQGWIVDVKSKDFTGPDGVKAYEENGMQLVAYREGIPMGPETRLINVFVSRTVPGLVTHHEWQTGETTRLWSMFRSLLSYWQLSKQYAPFPTGTPEE
jgi:hypothetical protein